MKRHIRISALVALALAAVASFALAQGGREPRRPRKPRPPLELALDANGDGVIDAGEIANASAALKKLDMNGDGKLTPDEYRPPRPPEEERDAPSTENGTRRPR